MKVTDPPQVHGTLVVRTPITDAAAAVRRLGRLVGTGVVAGGVLFAAIVAIVVYLDLSQPNVDPSNLQKGPHVDA